MSFFHLKQVVRRPPGSLSLFPDNGDEMEMERCLSEDLTILDSYQVHSCKDRFLTYKFLTLKTAKEDVFKSVTLGCYLSKLLICTQRRCWCHLTALEGRLTLKVLTDTGRLHATRRHPTQRCRLKANLPFVNVKLQLTVQDMTKQNKDLVQILTPAAWTCVYFSSHWDITRRVSPVF